MLKQRREPWFQFVWFLLHTSAAVLHLGSALYHLKRTKTKDDDDE